MPHECTLNRAFRLAGTNFGHFLLSSFAAADAMSAGGPKRTFGDRGSMSAIGSKADIEILRASRPLLTQSGHQRSVLRWQESVTSPR